jgi:hypothetical protein
MIERKIIIGLITSTEYIDNIRTGFIPDLLKSGMARRIASWCIEYYDKYNKAPYRDIADIYYQKIKAPNFPQDIAEEIEQDILPELSEESEQYPLNLAHLLDSTTLYLTERRLDQHCSKIKGCVMDGELTEAENQAMNYAPSVNDVAMGVDLSSPDSLKKIEKAFNKELQSVLHYAKQLGQFWNDQMVRGAFVALMASEKRGKSYWLLDMAVRACKQKSRVAFFQAGDMTEDQQLRRLCIYLARRSDLLKYCNHQWEPIRDCVYNQIGECDRGVRECSIGIFPDKEIINIKQGIELNELIQAYEDFPEYQPCYNCKEYNNHQWGVPWIKPVHVKHPLTSKESKHFVQSFFIDKHRSLRLQTYPNGTLSIKEIKAMLGIWEKKDGFVPDVIVIDYADLLVSDKGGMDFRHQQIEIWKGLRSLSQSQHCLLLTATQADADSYDRDRLKMKNFSEDKRKYAHVTAMYGLNQDKDGREKKIGLMRINEIVIREGDFSNNNEITILQNLRRGRPFLGSFK